MSSAERAARLLGRLDALAAEFAPYLEQAERQACLPQAIAGPLLREGFFRLWIPAACGGLELSLGDALRIYEAAATLDGSLGWAVMIGAGGGMFAAWLPVAGAQELFSPPLALVAGSGAASGFAERVPGGYRVRGGWRFASGAHHASVFTAACVVTEGGNIVSDAAGNPLVRAMSIAPADVRILESWDATGMRGTGSHDFEVSAALVPEHHSFSVITDAPRETGPLYQLPFAVLTELPVSAVGLGIARHALQEFAHATPAQKAGGAGSALIAARFAQARAVLELASQAVTALAEEAWRTVAQGGRLDERQLARITATCCVAQEQLRAAIGDLASVAGMMAIDRRSSFSRAWRDLQTLGAHGSLAPQRLVGAGSALLAQLGRSDTMS
ncbi:MAG TPA: acyl-CoA dehydrogenase family protein [Steroidobacteraceae bacterium]|nr:acyl-CoA dehydrogenase family protein [Steroidobacteraceae bacterium]